MEQTTQPLFSLGVVVATRGAHALANTCPYLLNACLNRHRYGDWGCVDAESAKINEEAVRSGSRILSAYPIDETKPSEGFGENTLWIITEADRSVTTFLLPEEY